MENNNNNNNNNNIEKQTIESLENSININKIMLLKFDNKESKYDEYIYNLDYKVVNITDEEIIEFYDIDTLPTILIYKNKNLIDSIEGFFCKSTLLKKISSKLGI